MKITACNRERFQRTINKNINDNTNLVHVKNEESYKEFEARMDDLAKFGPPEATQFTQNESRDHYRCKSTFK